MVYESNLETNMIKPVKNKNKTFWGLFNQKHKWFKDVIAKNRCTVDSWLLDEVVSFYFIKPVSEWPMNALSMLDSVDDATDMEEEEE